MELIQVKGNTWCLEGFALIPLYRLDERRCVLLDSGWSWEREKLKAAFEREGLTPVGVLGTHVHVDHTGNHKWLKETYGVRLCMTAGEAQFLSSPIMYKAYYNTFSMKALLRFFKDGFFCSVDQILGPEDGIVDFMGVPFRVHHTPGHSPDHICIGTPDGVCYLGDLLISSEELQIAQMPSHLVLEMARQSMEKMRGIKGYSDYIAAHRGVLKNLSAAVDENLIRLEWVCQRFLESMEKPVTWGELVEDVLRRNQLNGEEESRVVGYEAIIQAYVDDLKDSGRITARRERGIRWFQRA